MDGGDGAGPFGLDLVFHLHGFEDGDLLADRDAVSFLDADLDNDPGRGETIFPAGAAPRRGNSSGCARFGPFHRFLRPACGRTCLRRTPPRCPCAREHTSLTGDSADR